MSTIRTFETMNDIPSMTLTEAMTIVRLTKSWMADSNATSLPEFVGGEFLSFKARQLLLGEIVWKAERLVLDWALEHYV